MARSDFKYVGGYQTTGAAVSAWWNASSRERLSVETHQGHVAKAEAIVEGNCRQHRHPATRLPTPAQWCGNAAKSPRCAESGPDKALLCRSSESIEKQFNTGVAIMKPFASLAAALVITLAPALALAQDAIREVRVHFPHGASSTTLAGTLKGREIIDYKLGAAAGQRMTVTLTTDNAGNYFNLLAPGETEVAFFIGSTEGNRFDSNLAKGGDQTIRVYLVRSAARRNETAHYQLKVAITGAAPVKEPPAHSWDAKVPGTSYHATGDIPCSMGHGQPTGSCFFGVKREGSGSGIVTVTKPDGRTRAIFFHRGRATGYDRSQADPGEFRASRQGDLNIIHIGPERYEIPDAVIFGG